jgi:hypothetical protein
MSIAPGCEPQSLLNCTSRLEYLNTDSALELGSSSQDLENICPTLREGMGCIDDYSMRCLPEDVRTYFASMYNGTTAVIKDLCTAGRFQTEYLKHAPCMDSAKTEYKECVDGYNGVMSRIDPQDQSHRDINLKVMCCTFANYIECSNRLVYEKCGQETAGFTERLLDRLAAPIIQEHCMKHVKSQDECNGIMTSWEQSLSDGTSPWDGEVDRGSHRITDPPGQRQVTGGSESTTAVMNLLTLLLLLLPALN